MKKIIFYTLIFIFIIFPIFSKEDEEGISDITETKHYEKGQYETEKEGNTLNIRKGEGFDFKVPEIVIKGQIDTKIMLNREMRLLEDLQNVKNILYEKEKVYLPEQYVKEENIMPHKKEKTIYKDLAGKIKLSIGSYENFFAEGILGKLLDENSNIILDILHNSYKNEKINDRITFRNRNDIFTFYKTKYDFLDTIYGIILNFDRFDNPYPDNLFGRFYILDDIGAAADFFTDIKDYAITLKFKYNYFAQSSGNNQYIYKENRFTNNIELSKDFLLKDDNKVKFLSRISYFISNIFAWNKNLEKVYNIDALIKGIFYFDKIIFHGGVRLQNFNIKENYFRASPFFSVNYDILSVFSLYGVLKPEMDIPDYIKKIDRPFLVPKENLKPASDSVNIETGVNINIFNMNSKIYYGYKNTRDFIILDEIESSRIFSFYNRDISFWFTGIKIETIKTENMTVISNYEFKDIIEKNGSITYFPKHFFEIKFNYRVSDWEFDINTAGETIQYGTTQNTIPPYLKINLILLKNINENFSLFGYVNNLLNNTNYLLYYYKEKGLNLGIGTLIKF